MSSKKQLIGELETAREICQEKVHQVRALESRITDLQNEISSVRYEASIDREEAFEEALNEATLTPNAVLSAVHTVIRIMDQRTEALAVKKGISVVDLQQYEVEVLFTHTLRFWLGEVEEDVIEHSELLWEALSS